MTSIFQKDGWPIVIGLVALSLVPVMAGSIGLTDLDGAAIAPDAASLLADAQPITIHIVSTLVFTILGAFQFAPALGRRMPRWHQIAGQVIAVAGIVSALTTVYMTLSYDVPAHEGTALNAMRIIVGGAMTGLLVIGIAAARERDFKTHRALSIRAYALGMAGGTQVLFYLPHALLAGEPSEPMRALLMGAGWAVNLVIAEWIIRREKSLTHLPALAASEAA